MSQLKFLTPEQEALIPVYQEKWRQLYLSTQPIDRVKAESAVKAAYAVMGKVAPNKIVFCTSPRAALERLRSNIARVEIPTEYTESRSSQQSPNFFQAVLKTGWEIIKAQNKQRGAATKPLHDLFGEISSYSSKILAEQIDRALPKDLTTKDIVEQSFFSSSSIFNKFGKDLAERGDPDLSVALQDKPQEEWQESFGMTASALESQLAWLPAKGFLFRGWLKGIIQSTLICDRPTKILLDADNRLHGETEAALEFADGFVAYAHHNTPRTNSNME
jgi:hypothetical protein